MSEFLEKSLRDQKVVERILLVIFTIYITGLSYIGGEAGWWRGIQTIYVIGMVICWGIHLAQFKDYVFRARITSLMMVIGVVIYCVNTENMMESSSTLVALVIFMSLYEIPELIYLCVIGTIFLLLYHGFYINSIHFSTPEQNIRTILKFASIFLAEFISFYLVSKQRESNQRQRQTIEDLREAERTRDDFLANVSHELRTPINTICGMTEVALRKDLDPEIQSHITDIQMAGRNLLAVVSDILDFTELQAGDLELVEEAYNISSTIHDVINMSLAQKREKKIEFIVDCDANLPRSLLGDEQKIRRVIMNLVNNAIKFTNEGCVSIQIGCRQESYGTNLFVKVKDTGIGMREESLEKLFTFFSQVDTRRNRQESGLGLGLAISQAIVDRMGGFITVKSKYGKGSEIQFVIPQKVLNPEPIVTLQNFEHINIALYIDMEQFNMPEIRDEYTANIKHMVEQLGARVHICKNLPELKRRIEREQYTHIIISLEEYRGNEMFFDELSMQTRLILIIDMEDQQFIKNSRIHILLKPFFVLPIVNLLKETMEEAPEVKQDYSHKRFVAPDAHIMVVDDNLMNLKVMEGLLQVYQIKVTTAISGFECIEKLESKDYDFVFMDHMMPEMDGVETLEHIRNIPGQYYRNVPILALTANALSGMREMFLSKGFADFVAKPVEVSVLERVLRRNLPQNKIIDLEDEPKENVSEEQYEGLSFGDLNVRRGVAFCGGWTNYLDVLTMTVYVNHNLEKIETFFEEQDWKNYTILVHSIKSSSMNIGAEALSELAKKLEAAGKKEDISYILENHAEMTAEYRRVVQVIKEGLPKPEEQDEEADMAEDLMELGEEEFQNYATAFENAMFELDGDTMTEILDELVKYQYRGMVLREKLVSIRKKVEMSDYMAAADSLMELGGMNQ